MRNKRGIEISFQLIFAAIVGVIIFLFLIYFAFQSTDLFGSKTNAVVRSELNNALDSFGATQSSSVLDFKDNIELNFFYGSNFNRVSINGGRREDLRGKVVFVNEDSFKDLGEVRQVNIKDSRFLIWSYPWNVPYRVSNFIFIAKDGFKYSIVAEETIKNELSAEIPSIFTYVMDSGQADRVLKFQQNRCPTIDEKTVCVVYDNIVRDGIFSGTIYININGGIESFPFVGRAMIYAALFSDSESFNKVYNQMLPIKLNAIAEFYERKITFLSRQRTDCNQEYSSISEQFRNLDSIGAARNKASPIKDMNKMIIGKGCPAVF